MKRVLFVCTGNTCRSPMAQGLMNQLSHKKGLDIQATSAGIAASEGMMISGNALDALGEEGIDMSYHRARQLTANDISNANIIFCMTDAHTATVAAIYPQAMDKLYTLGRGISDPFGGDLDMYRMCRDNIKAELANVIKMVRELQ
jgi:protein-tyrosine-phosphatase